MAMLCVLLPAYNEARNIGEVVAGVARVRLAGVAITPLVVDDGSRDDTAEIARAAGATVVRHPVNRGVGAAFRTGRDWAVEQGADFLIHMDSDGQLLPAEIPRLFAPVQDGEADLALGSRFISAEFPVNLKRWRGVALRSAARTIGLLTGYRLSDISCGFRCMNRRIFTVVRPTFDYDYIQETLIQALAAHARVVEVPVTALYPQEAGQTSMSSRALRYGGRFLGLTAYAMARFYQARAAEVIGGGRQGV